MIEGEPVRREADFYPVDSWQREWRYYRICPVFSDEKSAEKWPSLGAEEVAAYEANVAAGWTSHIYSLTTPITSLDIKEIIVGPFFRLYPPFELNRKEAVSHSFEEVKIPVGDRVVTREMEVPDYAIRGAKGDMSIFDATPKYGLRIDLHDDQKVSEFLSSTLELIRQFTFQWWINTARNPFDQGIRIQFELQQDFSPRGLLKCVGRQGQNGPWSGAFGTQPLLGHEVPLDHSRWKMVGHWLERRLSADFGVTLFNNAVESYMSFRDRDTILNLALQFEVSENRVLLLSGKTDLKRNKDILKKSTLVSGSDRELFRKLITDRDNVAHGRPPYHLRKSPEILKEYMTAGRRLVDTYVDRMNGFSWEKGAELPF